MSRKKYAFLFMLIFALTNIAATQENNLKIRVSGIVTDTNDKPLGGVTIFVAGESGAGATSDEGAFRLIVSPNSKLNVSSIGYLPQTIEVNNRRKIIIKLEEDLVNLPGITVTHRVTNKVLPEPAEIELKKNYFYLRTRYRVPPELFKTDSRLIIQPSLINVTQQRNYSLKPLVFNGLHYQILVERGNVCGDKPGRDLYQPYATLKDKVTKTEIISYYDSVFVEYPKDEYRLDVIVRIETFCRAEYRDSFVVAKGTVYPLRFLAYDLVSMEMDSRFAPAQEPQLFKEKGEIKLTYRLGDARIYEEEGNNAVELKRMRGELGRIEADPTKELTLFQIKGFTSPDGSYEYNEKLAKRRMQNAVERITVHLNEHTLKKMKREDEAYVEPWRAVYQRMLADSLPNLNEFAKVLKRYKDKHNELSWSISRLPYYSVIKEKYLPPLRRVEYYYEYTEFRTLKNDEIDALYAEDYHLLTANEFWRFIESRKNESDENKEKWYRQALEVHPRLTIAANNLAVLLLKKNLADTALLTPFVTAHAPLPILVNQTLGYLQLRHFEKADQIAGMLPEIEECQLIKAVAAALNGNYEAAYPEIARQGGVNQVVLLLSMKRNTEAWEILKNQAETAVTEYLRAIAANRLNDVMNAMNHLQNAFRLDPSLRSIAERDGDVMDLLELK